MTLEQVQKITNQTLNVKYRAELASQDYKQEIEKMNEYLLMLNRDFKPLLRKIQLAEEQRIEFFKSNIDKFLKQFSALGSQIVDRASEFKQSAAMINFETDIKIFIDENKSDIRCPQRVEYKPYEHSEDVKKQKADLIHKINQQKISNNQQQIEEELKSQEISV
jgi:hypothetical protein